MCIVQAEATTIEQSDVQCRLLDISDMETTACEQHRSNYVHVKLTKESRLDATKQV